MGILDKIFGSLSDPEKGSVDIAGNIDKARIIYGTALSVNDSAINSFNSPSGRLSAPEISENGKIDLSSLSAMLNTYKADLAAKDTYLPISSRETADYVYEGSIKRGSRCVIRIVTRSAVSTSSSLLDVSKRLSNTEAERRELVFDKFSVESINESDQERYNIVETMGGDFMFSFGRRPRQISLSGTVVNGRHNVIVGGQTVSMDWKNALMRSYDSSMRSTKLFKHGDKITIHLQDTIYTGYMVNLITNVTSGTQGTSQVTIIFVIKERVFINNNDERIPGSNSVPSKLTSRTLLEQSKAFYKPNNTSDLESRKRLALDKIEDYKGKLKNILRISTNPTEGWESSTDGNDLLFISDKIALPKAVSPFELSNVIESFVYQVVYTTTEEEKLKSAIILDNSLPEDIDLTLFEMSKFATTDQKVEINNIKTELDSLYKTSKVIIDLTRNILSLYKEVNDIDKAL